MMQAPKRWKDDPTFQWETGCELADEELVSTPGDLSGLRGRIVTGAALGAGATASWWGMRAWMGAGAGVVGAFVVGLSVGGGQPTELAPISDVVYEVAAVEVASEAPRRVGAAVDSEAREEVAEKALPAEPVAEDRPAEVVADAPVEAVVIVAVEREPAPSEAASALEAELAVYERAEDALAEGRAVVARVAFEAYLQEFPEGRLRQESRLGLLAALHQSEDYAQSVIVGERLLTEGALSHKVGEIQHILVDSLVKLGRCDQALTIADSLSSKDRASVRRACR